MGNPEIAEDLNVEIIAEVCEELECEECGEQREAGNPVCKKCRFCSDCGFELTQNHKKYQDSDNGVLCADCNAAREREQNDGYCETCAGSGEGTYDGASCRACGGRGYTSGSNDDDYDCDPPSRDDY